MLEALLVSLAFILGTTALSLLVYLAMRRAMRASIDQAATDLAGSVLTRIAGLHALILALVFAQEMLSYEELKTENATEANAVADVYFDAARYGDGAAEHKIQDALFSYVRIVIDQEWGQLDDSGHLLQPAWDAWDAAYQGVLDLEPATGRQKSLREHMLDQAHVIATTRVKRESHESSISRTLRPFRLSCATSGLPVFPTAPLLARSAFGGN